MIVTVLGASGHVGSEVTNEAAARGHRVRAVARRIEGIPEGTTVERVRGDASDPAGLADLVRGSDAVISALHFDVTADALLSALRTADVDRLLVTGGAGGLEVAPNTRLIDTPEFPPEWKEVASAGIALLDALREEQAIDWTYLSPAAVIFEGPKTRRFRVGDDRLLTDDKGESRISFADFAVAMVDEVERPEHGRRRFTVAY